MSRHPGRSNWLAFLFALCGVCFSFSAPAVMARLNGAQRSRISRSTRSGPRWDCEHCWEEPDRKQLSSESESGSSTAICSPPETASVAPVLVCLYLEKPAAEQARALLALPASGGRAPPFC